jgi:hypothetical protein
MKLKPWAAISAAVVVGVGLSLAVPALTAVGQSSPPTSAISLGSTATLVAKGVAVQVPVEFTCPAGQYASIGVTLAERSGKSVVQGSSGTSLPCTGSPQSTTVTINSSGTPFKSGSAFAQASLFSCFYTCSKRHDVGNHKSLQQVEDHPHARPGPFSGSWPGGPGLTQAS